MQRKSIKPLHLTLAASLLMITACSPQAIPTRTAVAPVSQPPAGLSQPQQPAQAGPAKPAEAPQPLKASELISGEASLSQNQAHFQLRVSPQAQPGFRTQDLDESLITWVRLEVRDVAGTIYTPANADVNGLNPVVNGAVNLTVTGLPRDKALVVTVTGYSNNAPLTAVAGAVIRAAFDLNANLTVVPLNFASTPAGTVLFNLMGSNATRAEALDLDDLNDFLADVIATAGIHPSLVNTSNLSTDLQTLNLSQLSESDVDYRTAPVTLSNITVTGLATQDTPQLRVGDPASPLVNLTPNALGLDLTGQAVTGITPGTWDLTLESDFLLEPGTNADNLGIVLNASSATLRTINVRYTRTGAPTLTAVANSLDVDGDSFVEAYQGEWVTLTGTNLLATDQVSFNGTALAATDWYRVNNTTIVARTPADPTANNANDGDWSVRNYLSETATYTGTPDFRIISNRLVDDTAAGSNDGSSWANAYTSLATTLSSVAEAGDEIWVAYGTYRPGAARSDTFQLRSEIDVYGNFEGDEGGASPNLSRSGRSERPAFNSSAADNVRSILSGDIDSNDTYDTNDNIIAHTNVAGNSHHVVTGANTAVLEGFTIRAGNSTGAGTTSGAGMLNNGVSPSLSNLSFEFNTSAGLGGGLFNSNNSGSFSNLNFVFNLATDGGGIFNTSSSVSVSGLSFNSNQATGYGGGYVAVNSNGGLSSVIFVNNRAATGGGAAVTSGSSPTFTAATFLANVADNGGGLYISSTQTVTFADSANFNSNSAGTSGGGVFQNNGSLNFTGAATFTANNTINTTANSHGGAIYQSGTGSLNFGSSANFNDNNATNASADGGAIYAVSSGALSFTGAASFTACDAGNDGGAIYRLNGSTSFANTATFNDNNIVTGNGGGIYQTGSSALSFAEAASFTAHDISTSGNGGAIYFTGSGNLSFSKAGNFLDNDTASGNGGAIYNTSSGSFSFGELSSFTANNATSAGGAIYRSSGNTTFTLGGDFTGNDVSAGNGGAIYQDGGSLNFNSDGDFTGNSANAGFGGGILANNVSISFVDDVEGDDLLFDFLGNGAQNGGGIAAIGSSSISMEAVNFTGNIANLNANPSFGQGGAIFFGGSGNVSLTRGELDGNSAYGEGGGIFFNSPNSDLILSGIDADGDTSYNRVGGGVFFNGEDASISDSSFTGMEAELEGGAFHFDKSATNLSSVSFSNVDFTGNQSVSSSGGAIFIDTDGLASGNTDLSLSTVSFEGNSAELDGGALYLYGDSSSPLDASLSNVSFEANSVSNGIVDMVNQGGGLYAGLVDDFEMNRVVFDDNTAEQGGGLYLNDVSADGGDVHKDVVFAYNGASQGGGLFNGGGSEFVLRNGVFVRNQATIDGGGLFNGANGDIDLAHVTFSENVDSSGTTDSGAIFLDDAAGASLTMYDALFWRSVRWRTALGGRALDLEPGQGNIEIGAAAAADPFANSDDPAGDNDAYFDSDDGLSLAPTANTVIDDGLPLNPAAIPEIVQDITGFTRSTLTPEPGAYEFRGLD